MTIVFKTIASKDIYIYVERDVERDGLEITLVKFSHLVRSLSF